MYGPYRKSIDASLGKLTNVVTDIGAVRQMSGLDGGAVCRGGSSRDRFGGDCRLRPHA